MDGEKRIAISKATHAVEAIGKITNPDRRSSERLGISNILPTRGEIFTVNNEPLSPGREHARNNAEQQQIRTWNTRFE